MKERAAELRAEGKKGARKADGLQAVLDSIAEMVPEDRALAERVHMTVTATAPGLSPKTWYGMPAYRQRGRQGRRLLPERRQVQLPLLDPGLPGRGEPRRRRRVAGVVRAQEVEPYGGEEGRRAGEGRDLLIGAVTVAKCPYRSWYSALRAAPASMSRPGCLVRECRQLRIWSGCWTLAIVRISLNGPASAPPARPATGARRRGRQSTGSRGRHSKVPVRRMAAALRRNGRAAAEPFPRLRVIQDCVRRVVAEPSLAAHPV